MAQDDYGNALNVGQHHVEAVMTGAANKTTLGGAAVSGLGWVASSEFVAVMGLLIAAAGFFVSLYFQIRRDKREKLEHEARMEQIRRGEM